MKKLVLAGACLLLATPVLAQTASEQSGVNRVLGVAPSTADFVKEASMSDIFEIKESQLAAERGNAATKSFASQMVIDHQKTTSDLKGLIDSGKVKAKPATALDSSHQKMIDTLTGLKGADFDKQYRSDQVSAHKSAVSLFERYGKGGKNADLKAWASQTTPTLQNHLKMAQDLYKQT